MPLALMGDNTYLDGILRTGYEIISLFCSCDLLKINFTFAFLPYSNYFQPPLFSDIKTDILIFNIKHNVHDLEEIKIAVLKFAHRKA